MHTIMELRMRDRVCYDGADLHVHPMTLKGHFFCTRIAVQRRIWKKNRRLLRSAKINNIFIKNNLESQWSLDFSGNGLQIWSVGEKTPRTLMNVCGLIILTMFIYGLGWAAFHILHITKQIKMQIRW